MKRYAMAVEGTAFIRDGIDLSWPAGGVRDVIEFDPAAFGGDLPMAFRMRLLNDVIVETDDPPNKAVTEETPYRVYEGAEAREIKEEPAGPVIVMSHGRQSRVETEVTLLDTRDSMTRTVPTLAVIEPPAAVGTLSRTARRRGA